jgi:hypothetical protein
MEIFLPVGRRWCARERRALILVLALGWIAVGPRGVRAQEQPELAASIQVDSTGAVVRSISGEKGPAYHPTRVLVSFERGAPRDLLPESGPARDFPGNPDLILVENPHGLSVPAAVARYKANPNVLYAEPDYVVSSLDTTPSDPLWSNQWDMARIAAPPAWDK